MPQSAIAGAVSDKSTFAGVLAALTEPAAKPEPSVTEAASGWLNDLKDDVSLLSYERALKAQGCCRPGDRAAVPVACAGGVDEIAAAPAERASKPFRSRPCVASEELRKRASVTIRMSRAECERLQQRSAEAGLTASAYLRSCAFEVDSLREQVKQALAELRAAELAAKQPLPLAQRWWLRIFRPAGKAKTT